MIKKWEIWGAIFSILVGSLLHFTYAWSGHSPLAAVFSAVNESTWEHLKLAFWPTFIFAVIEWFVFGKQIKNFCLASMVKLFSMPIIIVGLFYGWLAIFPDNFFWDIAIFIIAVILGYYFSYRIMKITKPLGWEIISLIVILVGLLKFSLFTYFPPKIFLFQDPITGGYGIEKNLTE